MVSYTRTMERLRFRSSSLGVGYIHTYVHTLLSHCNIGCLSMTFDPVLHHGTKSFTVDEKFFNLPFSDVNSEGLLCS